LLAGVRTGDRFGPSQREFSARWPTAGTEVVLLFALDLQNWLWAHCCRMDAGCDRQQSLQRGLSQMKLANCALQLPLVTGANGHDESAL
jgi:hypothetical protein